MKKLLTILKQYFNDIASCRVSIDTNLDGDMMYYHNALKEV